MGEKMKEKVDMICSHDMNVFINRQLIYNYPEQLFADKGVMAIEHADFDGIERLALVTGGEIVSTFGHPDKVKIGKCDLIEQVSIGDETLLKFSGVPLGEACSVVLRGATEQIISEVGDGTTSVTVLASELIREAEKLIDMRIHPQTIIAGWRKAAAAEMILRVDNILKAAPRPRKEDR